MLASATRAAVPATNCFPLVKCTGGASGETPSGFSACDVCLVLGSFSLTPFCPIALALSPLFCACQLQCVQLVLASGPCTCCYLCLGFHSLGSLHGTTFLTGKFQLKCCLLDEACSDHSCQRNTLVPLLHNADISLLFICSLALPSTRMLGTCG